MRAGRWAPNLKRSALFKLLRAFNLAIQCVSSRSALLTNDLQVLELLEGFTTVGYGQRIIFIVPHKIMGSSDRTADRSLLSVIAVLIPLIGVVGAIAYTAYQIGEGVGSKEEAKISAQLENKARELQETAQQLVKTATQLEKTAMQLEAVRQDNSNLRSEIDDLKRKISCPYIEITEIQTDVYPVQKRVGVENGSTVGRFAYVFGKVTPTTFTGQILLVIHPVAIPQNFHWVQQEIGMIEKGNWRVRAEFGNEQTRVGQQFEIKAFLKQAVIQKDASLGRGVQAGDILENGWPSLSCASEMVTVRLK